MITINFPDTSFEVKSQLSELNLKEYEIVQATLNRNDIEYFEKFMLVIEHLGVPMHYVEQMDMDSYINFIEIFTNSEAEPQFIRKIELEGYEYVGIEEGLDKPKFTPNTIRLIERYMKKSPEKYFAEILAVFFKRTDLTAKEHYTESHLKYKANLFRQHLNANVAIPYIYFASESLLLNIKKINEHSK
jgi:hypothetical protein